MSSTSSASFMGQENLNATHLWDGLLPWQSPSANWNSTLPASINAPIDVSLSPPHASTSLLPSLLIATPSQQSMSSFSLPQVDMGSPPSQQVVPRRTSSRHHLDERCPSVTAPAASTVLAPSATRHSLQKKQCRLRKNSGGSNEPAKSKQPCPRGGVSFALSRRDGGGVWRRQTSPWLNSSENGNAIIATLASAHWDSDIHNPSIRIDSIKSAMEGSEYLDESLGSVVQRCRAGDKMSEYTTLSLALNSVPDSLSTVFTIQKSPISPQSPANKLFKTGIQLAVNLLQLPEAGLGLRISISGMEGTLPWDLANLLQSPIPGTVEGDLIINHIIPTISRMHHLFPISMASMFSPSMVSEHQVAREFDCTDIASSDRFIDSVIFNNFTLHNQNAQHWVSCYDTIVDTSLNPPIPLHQLGYELLAPMTFFLPRPYSPPLSDSQDYLESSEDDGEDGHPTVQQKGAEKEKIHDHQANNIWMECEQERAEKGNRVNDIHDLQSQLRKQYKEGMKISDDIYICIPMDAIPSSLVDIRNSDETLMAFICTSLPAKIQNSLTDNLLAVFGTPDLLTKKNTSVDADSTFQALYLSWYNCHCTKGHEALSDIPPSMLDKVGCVHTNHSQMNPYIFKDVKDNQKMFQSLKVIFEELFNWIHGITQTHLPEECQMLEQIVSILPGNHDSPASPFLSLVININVQTKAHHDSKDQEFCLVLPIGTFRGAALVMVEDFAIFRSSDITHLNLCYEGKRASILLHTDHGFVSWAADRNSWQENEAMRTFA
ncbi:hypothetical protein SERLA73DRAFT_70130 [Serpula lacrymans var. lacrymans S7.3]|uniref:Uncharacterized protein n=2 Tax=Serpula lacrymans var. lacrymans TaxID=341189 RepID=F8PM03_SERL3|nr:uncharacterized protein SERLADRAFT_434244 [Serpula lacrymans var. lacrymans S7.9]EGO02635.1 hypothetical protein SERLA73DRAFT_70130 [Serpula lacrymans var. lacrymans S7.3]EGO28339.1 hypothetical protein SERLADRAFT_434244 [Serpula lacrymans var. lacrymans S7.9]